jgi:hypothetical protein
MGTPQDWLSACRLIDVLQLHIALDQTRMAKYESRPCHPSGRPLHPLDDGGIDRGGRQAARKDQHCRSVQQKKPRAGAGLRTGYVWGNELGQQAGARR